MQMTSDKTLRTVSDSGKAIGCCDLGGVMAEAIGEKERNGDRATLSKLRTSMGKRKPAFGR